MFIQFPQISQIIKMKNLNKIYESIVTENNGNQKLLLVHGLIEAPDYWQMYKHEKVVYEMRNYEVLFPYIDYRREYVKDYFKSEFKKLLGMANGVDLIIGHSLGGYTAFLLSNITHKNTILINPSIDRSKTKLDIKEFDTDQEKTFSNPNIEIYLGTNDDVVPMYYTRDYVRDNNIKCDIHIMRDMGHNYYFDEIEEILDTSKFIKN